MDPGHARVTAQCANQLLCTRMVALKHPVTKLIPLNWEILPACGQDQLGCTEATRMASYAYARIRPHGM